MLRRRWLKTHTVGVAVVVGSGVRISGRRSGADFTDSDDTGGTAVDAELTASADVVVDDEYHRICRVRPGFFSAGR